MSTSVDPTPSEAVVADDDEVAGARPAACWSVREGDWRDQLPDELAALLAPPVIVSAVAFVPAVAFAPAVALAPAVARPSTLDDGVPTVSDSAAPAAAPPSAPDDGVPVAYSPRHAAPEEPTPRFIAPSLPRRPRRRRSAHAA